MITLIAGKPDCPNCKLAEMKARARGDKCIVVDVSNCNNIESVMASLMGEIAFRGIVVEELPVVLTIGGDHFVDATKMVCSDGACRL